jgi:NADH-quinone oxidoreductase subunit M
MMIPSTLSDFPILSLTIFLPFTAALLILMIRSKSHRYSTYFSAGVLLVSLGSLILRAFSGFDSRAGLQLQESHAWIPSLGIRFDLSMDGISFWLIALNIFLGLICIFEASRIAGSSIKSSVVPILLFVAAANGVFLAADLFLFLMFWGLTIAPVYFLLGPADPVKKEHASLRFLLFHFASVICLLLAVLSIYFIFNALTGQFTFDIFKIQQTGIPMHFQRYIFAAMCIAFAIRIPLFPFHVWLPEVLAEAPFPAALLIAGSGLKLGVYGFLRLCLPLCPDSSLQFAPIMVYVALISILVGALIALMQPEMKKLMAYSCVSQMGFAVLGIFVLNQSGLAGSTLLLLGHTVAFCLLFLIIHRLSECFGTTLIQDFGGLGKFVPAISGLFLFACLALFGMPGLSGFPGMLLIIGGTILSQPVWAVLASVGLVLSAAYLIWMYQRVFLQAEPEVSVSSELQFRSYEWLIIIPLILVIFVFGVYPQLPLNLIDKSVGSIDSVIQSHRLLLEKTPSGQQNQMPGAPFQIPPGQLPHPPGGN